jgi:hypothetical protein
MLTQALFKLFKAQTPIPSLGYCSSPTASDLRGGDDEPRGLLNLMILNSNELPQFHIRGADDRWRGVIQVSLYRHRRHRLFSISTRERNTHKHHHYVLR